MTRTFLAQRSPHKRVGSQNETDEYCKVVKTTFWITAVCRAELNQQRAMGSAVGQLVSCRTKDVRQLLSCWVKQAELFVSQLIADIHILDLFSCLLFKITSLADACTRSAFSQLLINNNHRLLTTKSAGVQLLNIESAEKAVSTNDNENVF
jgi:hypothetical protein